MRLLPLLLLAGCASPPSGGGGGIVSVNPCADAMLVRLVPASRIAAISHYSKDPVASSIPPAVAARFRATAGTAEEVIALQPALVVASTFTPPATRGAYARAGLKALYLDAPQTVTASVAQVRDLATAVGAPAAGEAMVAAIEKAASSSPKEGKGAPQARTREGDPRAILYIGNDLATGGGTLLDELMARAGFRNAAADYGLAFTGTLPAETLIARPPDLVIAPPSDGRRAALRRRLLPRTPEARFDRRLVNCGGPAIVDAMARLRAIRRAVS